MMRATLEAAKQQGELRRTHADPEVKPPYPASPSTLAALVRHDYLERGERRNKKAQLMDVWTITDAGLLALDPPPKVRKDSFNSMRAKGSAQMRVMVGGTWAESACPEPEKVEPRAFDPEAQARWNRAQNKRDQAAALARQLRAA